MTEDKTQMRMSYVLLNGLTQLMFMVQVKRKNNNKTWKKTQNSQKRIFEFLFQFFFPVTFNCNEIKEISIDIFSLLLL